MLALFWFFPGFLDFFDKKLDLIRCPVCLFALLGLYFVFFLSFFFLYFSFSIHGGYRVRILNPLGMGRLQKVIGSSQ